MTRALAVILTHIVTGAVLWQYVVAPYRLNIVKRAAAAQTSLALELDDERAAPLARDNIAALRSRANRWTSDAEVHVLLAANHRILRQYDRALAEYDRALQLEATPLLYMNRAVTALAAHRTDVAQRDLALAVRFDPSLASEAAEAMATYRQLESQ